MLPRCVQKSKYYCTAGYANIYYIFNYLCRCYRVVRFVADLTFDCHVQAAKSIWMASSVDLVSLEKQRFPRTTPGLADEEYRLVIMINLVIMKNALMQSEILA